MHVITPLRVGLQRYQLIRLPPVINLLPAHVSANIPRELGARLERALDALPSRPQIERINPLDDPPSSLDPAPNPSALVLVAALDDFEAGSRSLRLLEVGFNHVAVTVHVRMSRQDTGEVLGAISVTAQDDRESGTTSEAMDRVVGAIGRWVRNGYAR